MANRSIFTQEQALDEAAAARANLALSLLRVFNGTLVPDATTTDAQLVAAETTLAGYPAGGYPITAFGPPLFGDGAGAYITTPLIPIVYASGPSVVLGGAWLEDAAGEGRRTWIFDPPVTLAELGDGIEFVRQLYYGDNA